MTKGDDQIWLGGRPMKQLPEPDGYDTQLRQDTYNADSMQEYGDQRAAHAREVALEEAATWLDFYDGLNMRRAEAIRQMKAGK